VRALDGASLALERGEIHALVGENGAGKSTLVSIAAGRLAPDSGRILRGGVETRFLSAREARAAGVALVPQHDLLVGAASVADNLALLDPKAPSFETRSARRRRVDRVAKELGLELGAADARVEDLPVGTRQRIEIAGALLSDPEVLMLDEPTAVLAPEETALLFAALDKRAAGGRAVLVITHRIAEVFAYADRLTLLSRGKTLLAAPVSEATPDEVGRLLVAGSESPERAAAELAGSSPTVPAARGPAVLRLSRFHAEGLPEPVDIDLAAGELLTLLSIDGNGADVLASAVAGLHPSSGRLDIGGRAVRAGSPAAFRSAGGRFVPGDRRAEGVVAGFTIAENLALAEARGFFLDRAALHRTAAERIAAFGIRARGPETLAAQLSGGNQQKLVLARELQPGSTRVLVAVHPTRGLDLASAADVRRRIAEARAHGTAVLVVSAEPDDARSFAGAIRVVYRGRVGSDAATLAPAELGALMAGLPARRTA
jgi:general nucleoside transport system ATP-binding protein